MPLGLSGSREALIDRGAATREYIKMNGLEYENIIVCPLSREVLRDGRAIPFTTMEFDVLYFLISNPNIAFTKEQIYEAVMKDNYTEAAYAIRNIIYRIRSKTGLRNLKSLYGYGYKYEIK